MLETSEMRVFLAAAEAENFSAAARRLGISQPAVSMQIKALEQRLGTELFTRSGRYVTLSEAGMALVPMARDMVEQALSIEEAMASLGGEVVGLLRLACSTTAGKYVLPGLLARLQAQHPRVAVVCQVTQRAPALDMVSSGEAHIALTSLQDTTKPLEYRPFITDRIVLITRSDHPWARRTKPLLPRDLAGERFIMREENSGTTEALRTGLAWHELSLDDLETAMVLGNAEAIRMAVQEGIGAAFVSTMVVSEALKAGEIAVIGVDGLDLTTTLYMARSSDRSATPAQAAFWDLAFSSETEAIRQRPSLPASP